MEIETFLGIDYPTWWFLVVGALFSGYAILDGFDLGVGALHLFLPKDEGRRIAINAIGPVWDGNEVWIVIGTGALFAGFPAVYATVFSAFYIPFILFLVALIFRAVSIEFRGKEPMNWWKNVWDISFSFSSILIILLLGLLFGNILLGLPVGENLRLSGSMPVFLNPFAILVAVTTLALFMMHGAIFLVMKTEGKLFLKTEGIVKNTTFFFVTCYSLLTVYTLAFVPHLSDNFLTNPLLFIFPGACFVLVALGMWLVSKEKYLAAFLASSGTISLLLILVAIELFPTFVLSTVDPAFNITVYNAASSTSSLKIMLIIAAIGIPLVASYTTFVFWTFKGKVVLDETSY
ncbi:MAG: cytochrome d ubiquinol oxidase subunit II [Nitrospinota bacterium]